MQIYVVGFQQKKTFRRTIRHVEQGARGRAHKFKEKTKEVVESQDGNVPLSCFHLIFYMFY
jgi:hypothetical protein